jgi:surface antigen
MQSSQQLMVEELLYNSSKGSTGPGTIAQHSPTHYLHQCSSGVLLLITDANGCTTISNGCTYNNPTVTATPTQVSVLVVPEQLP